MPARLNILAVPNDDGYGPSALLSYVVKAILHEEPRAQVTVWNDFAVDFNRTLYAPDIEAGRVKVRRVWNLIQLARPDGTVSIDATLGLMGNYRRTAARYARDADPKAFDLVLDFGAPAAARWASKHRILSATVFDHAWSVSLRMVGGPDAPAEWDALADAIEADECSVQNLWLFPPFIAPPPFPEHWMRLVPPDRLTVLSGVLSDAMAWSTTRGREFLGIETAGHTMLIQGGGTAVWDKPVLKLVHQLQSAHGRSPLSRHRLNLVLRTPAVAGLDLSALRRVHVMRLVPGGTIQPILPAIDFAILRAGGGSVNDAIAHRVPFVCVREPAQRQIDTILRACESHGLTRALDPASFARDPLGTILAEHEWMLANRPPLASRLAAIPNDSAAAAARQILSLVR